MSAIIVGGHTYSSENQIQRGYQDEIKKLRGIINNLQKEYQTLSLSSDEQVTYINKCHVQIEELTRLNIEMKDQLNTKNQQLADLSAFEDYSGDKNNEYKITYPFPGYDKDDLKIEYQSPNKLKVCASSEHRTIDKTFDIPVSANIDLIEIRFKNGLLTVTVPVGKCVSLKIID